MVIILILSNSWGGFFGNHLSLVKKYHFWKKAIKEQHMLLSTRIICHFITHLLLSHTTKKKKLPSRVEISLKRVFVEVTSPLKSCQDLKL